MLTIGPLNDLPRIRHAFFTRHGGVSDGLYESLNCGYGPGDDKDRVSENRARAMARIGLTPDRLVTVYQVHSAEVAVVDEPWAPGEAPQADALVTRVPALALGVLTADCAPVLLADSKARVVGAAHAGWRGALDGVLEAVVEAMEALGAKRDTTVAGVGPTIAQRSYEVGPEFPGPLLEESAEHGDLFCPAQREGHYLFDLKGYVARRLARLELAGIQCLPCDTCREFNRFFSYRRSRQRGEPDYGRALSAIYLEP
jgi:YfiH family protein